MLARRLPPFRKPKECHMKFKTMILELLQQRPALHERLRQDRTLLATMERLASEMKIRHEALTAQLLSAAPSQEPSQIAQQAMEMAVQELEDSLLDE
jgi:hypothetical protein